MNPFKRQETSRPPAEEKRAITEEVSTVISLPRAIVFTAGIGETADSVRFAAGTGDEDEARGLAATGSSKVFPEIVEGVRKRGATYRSIYQL